MRCPLLGWVWQEDVSKYAEERWEGKEQANMS